MKKGSEEGAVNEGQELLWVILHKMYAVQVFECFADAVLGKAGVCNGCNQCSNGNPFVLCTLQVVKGSKDYVQWVNMLSRMGGGGWLLWRRRRRTASGTTG